MDQLARGNAPLSPLLPQVPGTLVSRSVGYREASALQGHGDSRCPSPRVHAAGWRRRGARAHALTCGFADARLRPERVGAGGSRVPLDQPLGRNAAWGPDRRLSSPPLQLPGRTALHLASANGHGGVVTLLLERGCQIDARDRKKRTALIKVCSSQPCPHEVESM
nr:POTE ankyrin domain family member A-like [Vicugna pacos]